MRGLVRVGDTVARPDRGRIGDLVGGDTGKVVGIVRGEGMDMVAVVWSQQEHFVYPTGPTVDIRVLVDGLDPGITLVEAP